MRIVFIILLFSFSTLVKAQTNIHKVIPGETIYTIARLYGTTAPRIAFLNHFDLLKLKLEVGQKIIIPSYYYEVKKKESAPTYKDYTIKAGDNFYSIARAHSLAVFDIIKVNKIKGNTVPKVGTVLRIPVKTNETEQISLQELKVNVQQGDRIERERMLELEFEAKEYFYVKNTPYKRAKLIKDYKELPIQIFYRAEIKIDTGRAKKIKNIKLNATGDSTVISKKKIKKVDEESKIVQNESDTNTINAILKISIDTSNNDESFKNNPNTPSLKEIAWEAYRNGDPKMALEKVAIWIKEDSLNAEAYYLGFLCHTNLGENYLSIEKIDKAIELVEDNGVYLKERADFYSKIKENKKAIEDLQLIEQKGMIKDELFIKIALLYELEDDFDNALMYYDKEIEFNPKSGISYYFKGMIYIKLSNKKSACESFNKAKDLEFKLAKEELLKHCK